MGELHTKELSNRHITSTLRKIHQEEQHKKLHGNYGTGRWVASSEFYGREGKRALKEELERRKKAGLISSKAGKYRKTQSQPSFGYDMFGSHKKRGKGLFDW